MDKNEKQRKWRKENPEKVREYNRRYKEKNPEKYYAFRQKYERENAERIRAVQKISIEKNKIEQLKWIEENKKNFNKDYSQPVIVFDEDLAKQKRKEYDRQRYLVRRDYIIERVVMSQNRQRETDDSYNTKISARNAISRAMKKGSNSPDYFKAVGYTKEEMISHLYSTIPEGYTWQDYLDKKLVLDHLLPVHLYSFTSYNDEEFVKCYALKNMRLTTERMNQQKGKYVFTDLVNQYSLGDILPDGGLV